MEMYDFWPIDSSNRKYIKILGNDTHQVGDGQQSIATEKGLLRKISNKIVNTMAIDLGIAVTTTMSERHIVHTAQENE